MRTLSPVIRMIFCIVLVCLLTSCTTVRPERFATVEEAYPPQERYQIAPNMPEDSYKKAVFDAAYADVFRAVKIAVTQVGTNIESSDESKGFILSTRDEQRMRPRSTVRYSESLVTKFYYAIIVKELTSSTTEVSVSSKVQIKCEMSTPVDMVGATVFSCGCFLPMMMQQRNECLEMSSIHWASDKDTNIQVLSQLINFTRNNLISAGAL